MTDTFTVTEDHIGFLRAFGISAPLMEVGTYERTSDGFWMRSADASEVMSPEEAALVEVEELDDNPGAACYHAFLDLNPQRGEVFTDVTGHSFVVVEDDDGPRLFSLRHGSRYSFWATTTIGLLTRARIVPADASVLTGPTSTAIYGDEYVRVRVNGAAPGEPEWSDMHLSQARARDLLAQLADALNAIVLPALTTEATTDLETYLDTDLSQDIAAVTSEDGRHEVDLICRYCERVDSLDPDQADTYAAHVAMAAAEARANAAAP